MAPEDAHNVTYSKLRRDISHNSQRPAATGDRRWGTVLREP